MALEAVARDAFFVTALVAAEMISVVVIMACSNGGDYCGERRLWSSGGFDGSKDSSGEL
jgi:hypothetical protein